MLAIIVSVVRYIHIHTHNILAEQLDSRHVPATTLLSDHGEASPAQIGLFLTGAINIVVIVGDETCDVECIIYPQSACVSNLQKPGFTKWQ